MEDDLGPSTTLTQRRGWGAQVITEAEVDKLVAVLKESIQALAAEMAAR
jgi:hypothetical protein